MSPSIKYNLEQLHRMVGQRLVMSPWFDLPIGLQWRDSKYRRLFHAGKSLHVGHNVHIDREHKQYTGSISIGSKVFISHDVLLDYTGHLTIGNEVWILQGTHILTHEHDITVLRQTGVNPTTQTSLVIEDKAYIGSNVTILPSCHRIGREAVIAAGAVVTHDVPDYTLVAGVPAKPVKTLPHD
ncbi:MAG: acyltransferase [Paludibacteraceae bacterium]|nr:acyltransferase [Paludibacteraceae bacterium]